jgi:hypothetical protein
MGQEGDTKYAWNPKNRAEVDAAREHFAKLKSQGFMLFKVKLGGRKGKEAPEFNPKDGKFLATPPKETEPEKGGPYRAEPARDFDPEHQRYMAIAPVAGG